MAKYIDADQIVFRIRYVSSDGLNNDIRKIAFSDEIARMPAADVVEVKHAYWKREDNKMCYWYICSKCGDEIPRNKYGGWSFPPYCPNCGAKMDGKEV